MHHNGERKPEIIDCSAVRAITARALPAIMPVLVFVSVAMIMAATSNAQVERFPRPDFESGYVRPLLETPASRALALEYLDVFVLAAALSLASFFALKVRSRRNIFILMLFSLAYFGFYRKGCVCPVGSVQNIALALFDSTYAVPLTVIAFFILPLVFTLFFGRTFCAAVCPLGAIQDVVILNPVPVRPWLARILGLIPPLYLGLAVLFAATGSGFVICRNDPFVGFFRFGASFTMLLLGVSFLVLGTVVARPYCRFLCPYGVILGWLSRLSKWHVTISPDECVKCRLCEESCPFDAIRRPLARVPSDRRKNIRRVAVLVLLLPLVVAGSGWIVSRLDASLSRQHFTVSLAEEIRRENMGIVSGTTEETEAFRASETTTDELYVEARAIRRSFRTGGWLLGGFLGLVVWAKILDLTVYRRDDSYTADTVDCLNCGRCFSYCPVEQVRRGTITPAELEEIKDASS